MFIQRMYYNYLSNEEPAVNEQKREILRYWIYYLFFFIFSWWRAKQKKSLLNSYTVFISFV